MRSSWPLSAVAVSASSIRPESERMSEASRWTGHEHQREVVAQFREIAIPGQQGGAQSEPVDRVQVLAGPAAGEEEGDVRVGGGVHG